MRVRRFSNQVATIGFMIAMGTAFGSHDADAAPRSHNNHTGGQAIAHAGHYASRGVSVARYARQYGGGGLQCVPFARENTGIELAGNAATWWNNAEGIYERGARPEVGSVLNFRANGRMRMGHVAVVSNVLDGRNIEIDHANWAGPGAARGGVSRNITVVDVSANNDWTAVRVELGHSGDFGSVYPTFGFIYDRPDKGVMVANTATAPALGQAVAMNAPPRDLRPAAERYAATAQDPEEVAEASDDVQPRFRRVSSHHMVRGVHGVHTAATRGKAGNRPSVTKVQVPGALHGHHGSKRST